MKILFLTRLYWPHRGGVEKHVEKVSKELMKLGYEVKIITEQYDQNLSEKETHGGVGIIRIPYFAIKSKLSLWTWIDKQMDLFDWADVVHVHDVFWWYWPIWASRLFKPVYITFHGYEGSGLPTKKAVMWRKVAESVCRGSICIGEFMKKWYRASPEIISYGAANQSVLPKRKDRTAVFLGRFDEDTGVLEYAQAVKQSEFFTKVYFYGDGSQKELLKKIIKNDKRCVIYPWTDSISGAMRLGNFVFVSRYLGILEAMQAKKLVVSVYNNQIKQDYLTCHPMRDNMIIAANSRQLVTRLQKIEDDPDAGELMIERAHDWAKDQTWLKLTREYVSLWQK
jgi:glycosyltransferase involved in cell wall biosynthesis